MTNIEWTDATWNPVTGCTKVSAGCKNCYAERLAPRVFAGQRIETSRVKAGFCGTRVVSRPRRFTDVQCHPDRLDAPLRWRKPRRVFVNSMSDLFHEDVPNEFIDKVFAVMALAPQHTFQVLTKRPERMAKWFDGVGGVNRLGFVRSAMAWMVDTHGVRLPPAVWPLPSVWLGVSCEDQQTADERIPILLDTPAAVRFVSAEPLLGRLNLTFIRDGDEPLNAFRPRGMKEPCDTLGIDWVIIGGESGPRARPCDVAWIRSIVQQCKAAGTACFVKQLGSCIAGELPDYRSVNRYHSADGSAWTPPIIGRLVGVRPVHAISFRLCDAKGGDPSEWPEDLRVRQWPKAVTA